MPTDPTAPLQLDQPEAATYEGYHHVTDYDYFWYLDPTFRMGPRVRVECIPGIKPRGYIESGYLLTTKELIRLTHLQTCAARYMAVMEEHTPGPKEGAHEPEARGGQSPP